MSGSCENRVILNPDITEVMILRSASQLRHLEPISTVSIAGAMVPLVDTIKMTSDTKLSFDMHVHMIE